MHFVMSLRFLLLVWAQLVLFATSYRLGLSSPIRGVGRIGLRRDIQIQSSVTGNNLLQEHPPKKKIIALRALGTSARVLAGVGVAVSHGLRFERVAGAVALAAITSLTIGKHLRIRMLTGYFLLLSVIALPLAAAHTVLPSPLSAVLTAILAIFIVERRVWQGQTHAKETLQEIRETTAEASATFEASVGDYDTNKLDKQFFNMNAPLSPEVTTPPPPSREISQRWRSSTLSPDINIGPPALSYADSVTLPRQKSVLLTPQPPAGVVLSAPPQSREAPVAVVEVEEPTAVWSDSSTDFEEVSAYSLEEDEATITRGDLEEDLEYTLEEDTAAVSSSATDEESISVIEEESSLSALSDSRNEVEEDCRHTIAEDEASGSRTETEEESTSVVEEENNTLSAYANSVTEVEESIVEKDEASVSSTATEEESIYLVEEDSPPSALSDSQTYIEEPTASDKVKEKAAVDTPTEERTIQEISEIFDTDAAVKEEDAINSSASTISMNEEDATMDDNEKSDSEPAAAAPLHQEAIDQASSSNYEWMEIESLDENEWLGRWQTQSGEELLLKEGGNAMPSSALGLAGSWRNGPRGIEIGFKLRKVTPRGSFGGYTPAKIKGTVYKRQALQNGMPIHFGNESMSLNATLITKFFGSDNQNAIVLRKVTETTTELPSTTGQVTTTSNAY